MTLKQLKYFAAVVEEKSITAAARKLYVSQPPLSAQIKALEESVGCALLERGARHTVPTDAGKVLYNHALSLLSLSRLAKDEVAQTGARAGSTLRIGMVSSIVCSVGVRWIEGFLQEHTGISIEITEANTYELLEKLHANLIQLAILRTPFSNEGLLYETLYTDKVIAMARRDMLNCESEISVQELAQWPLLVYRRWEHIVRMWFDGAGLDFRPYILCDDARTTLHFVQNGLGVGIMPQSTVALHPDPDIVCTQIASQSVVSDVQLAYVDKTRLPPAANAFIAHIRGVAPIQ